jgi:predicted adenine nucleotide alpha hydrolase (AANH) superfamily ATPase
MTSHRKRVIHVEEPEDINPENEYHNRVEDSQDTLKKLE